MARYFEVGHQSEPPSRILVTSRDSRRADGHHPPPISRAPPSSLTLSLPPANNISSSASLISADPTFVPPSRAMLACATRRISSLMKAAPTPPVRFAAPLTTVSVGGRAP